jgi:5-methylcytosine-specific restriction endonuclease McrA
MKRRIIQRDKGICRYCGCKPKRPIIEHVIPASQGGLATSDNLVVACQSCNVRKRYRDNA